MSASIDNGWKTLFRALPGYPWLPCPICKTEGFPNAVGSCDHTVKERAISAHPGLYIPARTVKEKADD